MQTLTKDLFAKATVVVIGSGPAGMAAAISCVKDGLEVIVITNAQQKTNAAAPSESVHPGIESLLKMIDAGDAMTAASRAVYNGITTNREHSLLGNDEAGVWEGHHIDRNVFDHYLTEAARKQQVSFLENETVHEILQEQDRVTGVRTSSGKIIRSAYVIDASGHKRIAGKKLKFQEQFYSPPFVVWSGVTENIKPEFFHAAKTEFIPSPQGWSWLAPEPPSRCTWTRFALKGETGFHQPPQLDQFGSTNEIVVANRRWRAFRPLVKEGLVLCGDAAGILDPAAGQGIVNALWSGIHAAQCVSQCITSPAMESFYLAQYDQWFISRYEEKVKQLKEHYTRLGIQIFEKENISSTLPAAVAGS